MALGSPVLIDATAANTIYTFTPSNSNLLPKLVSAGIIGPIIFTQAGEQRKFNISKKAINVKMKRTLDNQVIAFSSPVENIIGFEFTFAPGSQTIQALSSLAQLQDTDGPIAFNLTVVSPTLLTTANYPIAVLTSNFSGIEENERREDYTFEFQAIPPSYVNIGALANLVGSLI